MTKTEHAFWEEIQKASTRIGFSDESAMEWLLRFAQTEVGTLSQGQWLDLRAELEVFFSCGPPKSDHDLVDQLVFADPKGKKSRTWSPFIDQQKGVVPHIQQTLSQAFRDLLEHGKATFESIKITPCIVRDDPKGKPRILPSPSNDPQDLFLFYAIELLETFKKQIHSCRECGRIFLGYRFKQNFCSTACQNRTNQRKFRERREQQGKDNKVILKPGKLIPAKRRTPLSSKGSA